MTLWKCYYHLIWATNRRLPTIDEDRERVIRAVTIAGCREMAVLVHEIGLVADHVHLAVSIPPKQSVSDVVQRIKGSSSRALGEMPSASANPWIGWQQEYGVMTFGERSLVQVVDYVRNQKTHHANGTILAPFEQIERIRPT